MSNGKTVLIGVAIGVVLIVVSRPDHDSNTGDNNLSARSDARENSDSSRKSAKNNATRESHTDGGNQHTANDANSVALTFDDGPSVAYTPQILDILDDYDVTGIFCVTGENAASHPDLVRRIVDEGHVLCNHGYTHDSNLGSQGSAGIEAELADTQDQIVAAVPDADVPYFRQPNMFVTDTVGAVSDAMGYQRLDWTIDTLDWTEPGSSYIVDTVTRRLEPGAVVLFHDGGGDRSDTVRALPDVLEAIDDAGLEVGIHN